jgi:hypothetical protein
MNYIKISVAQKFGSRLSKAEAKDFLDLLVENLKIANKKISCSLLILTELLDIAIISLKNLSDPIEAYVMYKWEDKEFLGEVSEFVRPNNNYRMRVRMQEKIENEPDLFSTSLRRFYSRFWNG